MEIVETSDYGMAAAPATGCSQDVDVAGCRPPWRIPSWPSVELANSAAGCSGFAGTGSLNASRMREAQ